MNVFVILIPNEQGSKIEQDVLCEFEMILNKSKKFMV